MQKWKNGDLAHNSQLTSAEPFQSKPIIIFPCYKRISFLDMASFSSLESKVSGQRMPFTVQFVRQCDFGLYNWFENVFDSLTFSVSCTLMCSTHVSINLPVRLSLRALFSVMLGASQRQFLCTEQNRRQVLTWGRSKVHASPFWLSVTWKTIFLLLKQAAETDSKASTRQHTDATTGWYNNITYWCWRILM